MRKIFCLFFAINLTSCNTHKATISELENKSSNYQMTYDAMRRGTIISIDKEGNITKMLSEVQPDAAVTQTTDLANKLSAKLNSGDSITASQITKITESLSTLGQRTAAVNILRDALYRLEEHCLNFPENCKDQYWSRYDTVVKQIVSLQKEITNQSKQETEKAAEETKKVKAEIRLKSLDVDLDARTNYQIAVKYLLDKDLKNSSLYFELLYEKYPTHFNIDEINKKLIGLAKNGMTDKKWKELYKHIIEKDLTYKIDDNLLKQITERAKN